LSGSPHSKAPPPPKPPAAYVKAGSHVFALDADRIHVIGSGERAQVRLLHDSVAPAHATICAHEGALIVEDLGSPGGTFVGEQRILGEQQLPDGAVLRLGAVRIQVSHAPPPPVAHSPKDPDFGSLMADELRRAPWFALSALLHAVLFLLLYALAPISQPTARGIARIAIDAGQPTGLDTVDIDEAELEIEVPETEAPIEQLSPEPLEEIAAPDAGAGPAAEAPSTLEGVAAPGVALFAPVGGRRGEDILSGAGGGGGKLSGGFKRTVTGLRESGLEIVFVLDSTGSMGPVLDATKRKMVRMLEVLHALVPDARVGIVAYRDHGPGESYVTRALPLGRDLYRSLNFMRTIDAAGGGDRPEAVLAGLEEALAQTWRERAKRVVVVIGDAPAHRWAEQKIEALLRRFSRDGKGFVHAITTSTELFGAVSRDTRDSFHKIAAAGQGLCVPSEHEDTILRQVMTLAIGTEYRDAIDEVFQLLEQRQPAYSTRARDAVRRADPAAIAAELRRPVVEDGFVQGLIDAGSAAVAIALIEALKDPELPPTGQNAAAYALQRMLTLREPPIDPLAPRPLDARGERDLRAVVLRLR
jgi:hypothetical protein